MDSDSFQSFSPRIRVIVQTLSMLVTATAVFDWCYGLAVGAPISGLAFTAIALGSTTLGLIAIAGRRSTEPWRTALSSLLGGTCAGLEGAFFLLGLVSLYEWYSAPSDGRFEPLVTLFAVATGFAEGMRRVIDHALHRATEGTT